LPQGQQRYTVSRFFAFPLFAVFTAAALFPFAFPAGQHEGFSLCGSCSILLFIQQQQVREALRSGEQPQIAQSPEHSPLMAWARAGDLRARDARGLSAISE
jgi:hypothetical protein